MRNEINGVYKNTDEQKVGELDEDIIDEAIRLREKKAMKKPSDDILDGAIQFLEDQAMKNQDAEKNANDKASEPMSQVSKAGLFGSSSLNGNEHAAQVGQEQQGWLSWAASKIGF